MDLEDINNLLLKLEALSNNESIILIKDAQEDINDY
tara:strand:+ start:1383 stop:1490 length:108 start_codon:yes stop_codon:yes gene_type:complete